MNGEVGCWNRSRNAGLLEPNPEMLAAIHLGPGVYAGDPWAPPPRFPSPIQVKSPLHCQIFHSSGSVKRSGMRPGQTRWAGPQNTDTHGHMNANVFKHEEMKRKQNCLCVLATWKTRRLQLWRKLGSGLPLPLRPSDCETTHSTSWQNTHTKTHNTAQCAVESALSQSKDMARRSKRKICSFVCINGHQNRLSRER